MPWTAGNVIFMEEGPKLKFDLTGQLTSATSSVDSSPAPPRICAFTQRSAPRSRSS